MTKKEIELVVAYQDIYPKNTEVADLEEAIVFVEKNKDHEVARMDKRIKELEDTIRYQRGCIQNQTAKIGDKQAEIEGLQAEMAEKDTTIQQLTNDVTPKHAWDISAKNQEIARLERWMEN